MSVLVARVAPISTLFIWHSYPLLEEKKSISDFNNPCSNIFIFRLSFFRSFHRTMIFIENNNKHQKVALDRGLSPPRRHRRLFIIRRGKRKKKKRMVPPLYRRKKRNRVMLRCTRSPSVLPHRFRSYNSNGLSQTRKHC